MAYPSSIKTLLIPGIIALILGCIPREDPPEDKFGLSHDIDLPRILNENSGMTGYKGLIWFINDSGNDSVIYGYDRSQNTVTSILAVANARNTDWEEITQNSSHVFIGDFGNNATGNRTDLRIYMIDKTQIHSGLDTIDASGVIRFNYEDQTDFSVQESNTTSFDCEAFIATEEMLILFTKDWQTLRTKIYTLPVSPGNHTAQFITEWKVEGLISGAAWTDEYDDLYLLGYTDSPFIWKYSDFNPTDLSYSKAVKTVFEVRLIQAEGILIEENGEVLISSEAFTLIEPHSPAALFRLTED